MSDYVKATNFAAKDGYPVGDTRKKVKGTEIDNEFNAIASAVSTKANTNSPEFTGTPVITGAVPAATTDSTQIATTAFVQDVIAQAGVIDTAQIADAAVTDAKIADGLNGKGTRTVSTSDPTGGSDGDIWYKVSA